MTKKRFLSLLLAAVLALALTVPAFAAYDTRYDDDWVYICIDPGHGGIDSGCVATYDGKQYTERDLCMQIGLYLKEELESYRHVKVFLTRTPDTPSSQLPSGESKFRSEYALAQCCDFFISLHLNDVAPGTAVPSGASSPRFHSRSWQSSVWRTRASFIVIPATRATPTAKSQTTTVLCATAF